MGAEYITDKKFNDKREKLADVLPLKTPFNVQIFVSNICNFRCNYCAQCSNNETQHKLGLVKEYMSLETFKKCIDNLKKMGRIKQLVISGMGEPLLNPNIIEMISYAKENEVAKRIELVTNGSLLKGKLADELININIDRVRISIQGICSKDYERVSNVKINYNKFVDNIEYFYRNKKDTTLYIKIIDEMLTKPQDKKVFMKLYDNICDEIAVESLTPPPMECELKKRKFIKNRSGGFIRETKVCALPFYSFIINYDGSVYPCCVLPLPRKIGDAREDLSLVWNKGRHKEFLMTLLEGNRDCIPECKKCDSGKYVMTENDYLDDSVENLKEKYMSGKEYE